MEKREINPVIIREVVGALMNYAAQIGISENKADLLKHFTEIALRHRTGFYLPPGENEEAEEWLKTWGPAHEKVNCTH